MILKVLTILIDPHSGITERQCIYSIFERFLQIFRLSVKRCCNYMKNTRSKIAVVCVKKISKIPHKWDILYLYFIQVVKKILIFAKTKIVYLLYFFRVNRTRCKNNIFKSSYFDWKEWKTINLKQNLGCQMVMGILEIWPSLSFENLTTAIG